MTVINRKLLENYIKGNMKGLPGLFDSFFRIVTPLIYLYLWYAIPASIFGKENVDIIALTVSALPVIFIGVISRQTNWSIGGKKGVKGDNIGRKVRATVDRRGSFEFEGIDMDGEKVKTVIDSVTKNPIFTDKKRQDG